MAIYWREVHGIEIVSSDRSKLRRTFGLPGPEGAGQGRASLLNEVTEMLPPLEMVKS